MLLTRVLTFHFAKSDTLVAHAASNFSYETKSKLVDMVCLLFAFLDSKLLSLKFVGEKISKKPNF